MMTLWNDSNELVCSKGDNFAMSFTSLVFVRSFLNSL